MEINITEFYKTACPSDYSASVAEKGQNAGADTWRAACDDAPDFNLLDTEEKRQALRDLVKGFGAWSPEEIAAWSDTEVNALFIQLASGDIREKAEIDGGLDWPEYYALSEAGTLSGTLFQGGDGEIYYSLDA